MIGPNGSGKTTILRALVGAVPVERAEIVVAGETLVSSARGLCLPMERRRLGYVPQGYGLFSHQSALDNVAFGLSTRASTVQSMKRESWWRGKRRRREQARARALSMLEILGCGALAERPVSALSGGEQQRVALARALVIEPAMLLLDEPLAALDAITRRAVRRVLAEHLASCGRPSLLVTHDLRDVEALDARICALDHGRVVQVGQLDELRAEPATDFVAEFCGLDSGSRKAAKT
nr:ABC transporter ATP-binding protein [Pseudenhygromyxa sp. WMMC2535]